VTARLGKLCALRVLLAASAAMNAMNLILPPPR
jgi:hypothetical protein